MLGSGSRRHCVSIGVLLGLTVALSWACSTGTQQNNPVAPSVVSGTDAAQVIRGDGGGADDINSPPISLPSDQSGPMDVTFPPRNEPLLFRTALEVKYRDGLRRSAVQTFVDQEGTVVWTQEYLRYRVNLCSHVEAVLRVFRQIDGQGIQPICGTTATAIFPPRNEPFDFMVQLEAKYRDGLRRASGPSFVDVEGNIVWTQEYLRYRVSACSHIDAQQKVFDQIDGRGVQSDCAGATFTGTWRGTVRSTSCTSNGFLASLCGSNPSIVDTLTLVLTQSGNNVSGSISVGGFPASASGTATGNRLSITGRNVGANGITTSYESWDTSLSGSNMIGGFTIGLSAPGLTGFARYTMSLSSVSKTASIPSTDLERSRVELAGLRTVAESARASVRRQ